MKALYQLNNTCIEYLKKYKSEVERQIKNLLDEGKIAKSNSPFAHPIVCVAKKNGEVRVCTDLRFVNSITVDDAFPIPRIEDLVNKISSARYLSSLKCSSGY